MFGAIVNTHASDRGNEPVTWNQFHTFANQMDTNFSIVNSRIHATHREILEVRAQFIQLDEKINRLDERINRLEVRLDERINKLDEKINGVDEKINQLRGYLERSRKAARWYIRAYQKPALYGWRHTHMPFEYRKKWVEGSF